MPSPRSRFHLIAIAAILAGGPASCDYDDDDCGVDDDDFSDDDDFDDDDFDDNGFDDDDFDDDDDCSIIIIRSAGTAVVLVTDRPRPELRSARITLADVALESDEVDPQPLYRWSAGHSVDLVSLRGTEETRLHDLLVARRDVKPASYTGIRFTARDPALVLASGEAIGPDDIDLAGGGSMSVGFRRPLLLGPEDVVYIVLDFDLERSIEAGGEEAGARWAFRPVVLVETLRAEVEGRLRTPTDLSGVASGSGANGKSFLLELSGGRGSIDVDVAHGAAVLNGLLEPRSIRSIEPGTPVVARGAWTGEGKLSAEAVVLGETFEASGIVRDVRASEEGCIDAGILVTRGEGIDRELRVRVCAPTLVSLGRIDRAGFDEIREGSSVAIRASGAGGAPALASLFDLAIDAGGPPASGLVSGRVIAVDARSGAIAIENGQGIHEVNAGGASIVLIEETGGTLRQEGIPIQALREGMLLEVDGGLPGSRSARLLIAVPSDSATLGDPSRGDG